MPSVVVMQGKCLFQDISRSELLMVLHILDQQMKMLHISYKQMMMLPKLDQQMMMLTVIHLQFGVYGFWDSLFLISMSPNCKLMSPDHYF